MKQEVALPGHVAAVLALWLRGELATAPGEITRVLCMHDEGCPALEGGPCECEPEIRVRRSGRSAGEVRAR